MVETIMVEILGANGVAITIGLIIFFTVGMNSEGMFRWIEEQTFGTRTYILEKCELMFIKLDPQKLTYALLGIAFGPSVLIFGLMGFSGNFFAGAIFALLFSFAGWKLPRKVVDFMVARRILQYQTQMVDALMLLANSIRAGQSMPQALSMVVDQLQPPISQEFNKILQDNRLGMPIEDCFEKLAERIPTEDNKMFATSFTILNEMGGNLAETFDTIVVIIRERMRIFLKIRAIMATGKSQASMMLALPFVLSGVMYMSEPESMKKLFVNPMGIVMLVAALGLIGVSAIVLRKIIDVKV